MYNTIFFYLKTPGFKVEAFGEPVWLFCCENVLKNFEAMRLRLLDLAQNSQKYRRNYRVIVLTQGSTHVQPTLLLVLKIYGYKVVQCGSWKGPGWQMRVSEQKIVVMQ